MASRIKKVVLPSYTPTSDTEMLGKGRKELQAIAAGRTKAAKRAQAELDRRKGNKPYKAHQRALKAAAAAKS